MYTNNKHARKHTRTHARTHLLLAGAMDIALGLRTMVIPTMRDDTLFKYNRGGDSSSEPAQARKEWVMHLQVRHTDCKTLAGIGFAQLRKL